MVMPLVLAVTGLIFYLTFFLYNQCVVAQDTYILAMRGSLQCGKDAEEVKQQVLTESRQRFGTKYVGATFLEHREEVDKTAVTVEARGAIAQAGWKFGAKGEAQRLCPVKCIREVRLAKKIMQSLENH